MNIVANRVHTTVLIGGMVILFLVLLPNEGRAWAVAHQDVPVNKSTINNGSPAVASFKERTKQYLKLRDGQKGKLPKISNESKPAEIEAYKTAFEEAIRTARADAKPGDIFTPEISAYIKKIIRNELKGERLTELHQKIATANVKGVPLRVNYPYPETKELLEMPPTLLLKLPELPKELRYYFVGRNLLLIDRDARLIVDYLTDALP